MSVLPQGQGKQDVAKTKFELGDAVILKETGQIMVVISHTSCGAAMCVWTRDGCVERHSINEDKLERVIYPDETIPF